MDPLPAKTQCVDSEWSLTLLVKHELGNAGERMLLRILGLV